MSSLVLQSLGWALVHLLWQGTLVASVLALALLLVGPKAARVRYGLACGALGLLLALPVATGWSHFSAARAAEASRPAEPPSEPRPALALPRARPSRPMVAQAAPAAAPVTAPSPLWEEAAAFAGAHMPWLVLAWALGVAGCSLRLLSAWLRLRRLVREALPAPAEWQQRLEALSGRLGLPRAVRLLQSSAVDVPAAIGWLRPVVLLPVTTLAGLSPRQLEMVLAHELAHIRRHDFAVNLVQTLVETLLFYHPAVWWVSHVIRVEREHCCDDIAVSASGSPVAYARALTALETLRVEPVQAGPAVGALAPSALGGSLPERVRRLVTGPGTRCSSRWVAGASVFTLVSSVAVAAPLAMLVVPEPARPAAVERLTGPSVIAPLPSLPPAPLAAVPPPPPAPVPPLAAGQPTPRPAPAPAPRHHMDDEDDDVDIDVDEDDALDARTRVGDALTINQLVSLKIAGVTPELVQQFTALGLDATVKTLTELGHAGVTPAYVQEMNARLGRKLDAEELAELKHVGVTPDYLEAMKAAGFGNAPVDDLTGARAVGVTPEYVKQMKAAGFDSLSLDDLTGMRAVGVTPEYLAELGKLGFSKLSADDVTGMRAVGVNAGYVRALQEAGVKNLTHEELTELRAVGVDGDYVRSLRELGLKDLSAEQLTELRALGVSPAFVREMREAGLENLSVEELTRLRAAGVDSDFVRRMKKSGK